LNNLSNQQSDTGDRAGALSSVTEAVEHYRQLAAANPAVFLPDLATSLNNLSACQGDTGDRAGALSSVTEAVDIRRQLAAANPAAFLPDLAMSLNNLSACQGDTGDRAGALASVTEAVEHYRQLAAANPAAFLPDLAMSLNNLSNQQRDAGKVDEVDEAWQNALDILPYSGARAELRAAWAGWLAATGQAAKSQQQLRQAAAEADEPPTDHATMLVIMRARQAVRAALAYDTADHLPLWASLPLPDPHVELVNFFGRAAQTQEWPLISTVLTDHRELLVTPDFRQTVIALQGLYLDNPVPTLLAELLNEIDDADLDAVLARHQTDYERRVLLENWISTKTWSESFAFLQEHKNALDTEEVRQLLIEDDSDSGEQHLAVLDLTTTMPHEAVHAIVTDANAAEQAAFDAIQQGNIASLQAIALASASLPDRELTWAIVTMVLLLAANQTDEARQLAEQMSRQATDMQRRAHAIRLTRLRNHRPDIAVLNEIIDIIRPQSQINTP
jgi:tetratricopeptide (TPR) repeat protein